MLVKNIKPASKKKPASTNNKSKKPAIKKQQPAIKSGIMMLQLQQDDDFQSQMLKQIQQENRRKQLQRKQKQDKLKKSQPKKLQALEIEDMGEFENSLKMRQEEGMMKELQKEKRQEERQKLLVESVGVDIKEVTVIENNVRGGGNGDCQHMEAGQQSKGSQLDLGAQRGQVRLDIPVIPKQPQPYPQAVIDHEIDQHIAQSITQSLQVDIIDTYSQSPNEINSPQAEQLKYTNHVSEQQVVGLGQQAQEGRIQGQQQQKSQVNVEGRRQWEILVEEEVVMGEGEQLQEEQYKGQSAQQQQQQKRELQIKQPSQQVNRQQQKWEQQQLQQQHQQQQLQQQQLQHQQHQQSQQQQHQQHPHQYQRQQQHNLQPTSPQQYHQYPDPNQTQPQQQYQTTQQPTHQPIQPTHQVDYQHQYKEHQCQPQSIIPETTPTDEQQFKQQTPVTSQIITSQLETQPQRQIDEDNNDAASNITLKKSAPVQSNVKRNTMNIKSMLKKKKPAQGKTLAKQPKSLILSSIIDTDEFMIEEERKQSQVIKQQQQQKQQEKLQPLNQQQQQYKQYNKLYQPSQQQVQQQQPQRQQQYITGDDDKGDKDEDKDKSKQHQFQPHNQHSYYYQETNTQQIHPHVQTIQVQQSSIEPNNIPTLQPQQIINSPAPTQQQLVVAEQQQQLPLEQQVISFIKPLPSSLVVKKKNKPKTTTLTNNKFKSSSYNAATGNKKPKTVSLFLSQLVGDVDEQGEKQKQQQTQYDKQQVQQHQYTKQQTKETVLQTFMSQSPDQPSQTLAITETPNSPQVIDDVQPQLPARQETQPTTIQQQLSNDPQSNIVPTQYNPKVEEIQLQQSLGEKQVQLVGDDDRQEEVVQFTIFNMKGKQKQAISANPAKKALGKKAVKKPLKTATSSTLKPVPKYQPLIIMDAEDIFTQLQPNVQNSPLQQPLQSHPSVITNQPQEQMRAQVVLKQQQCVMEEHSHKNRVDAVQDKLRQQVIFNTNTKCSAGQQSSLKQEQQGQVILPTQPDDVVGELSSQLNEQKQQLPHASNDVPIPQREQSPIVDQSIATQQHQFAPILALNKQKKKKANVISSSQVAKKLLPKKCIATKATKSLFLPQLQQFTSAITNDNPPPAIDQQLPIVVESQSNQLQQSEQLTKTPYYYQQVATVTVNQSNQITPEEIVKQDGKVDVVEVKEQVLSGQQQQTKRDVLVMESVQEDIARLVGKQTQLQQSPASTGVVVAAQSSPDSQQYSIPQLTQPITQQLTFIPRPKPAKSTIKKTAKPTNKSQSQSKLLSAANKLSTGAKQTNKSTTRSVMMNFTIEEDPVVELHAQGNNKQVVCEENVQEDRQIVIKQQTVVKMDDDDRGHRVAEQQQSIIHHHQIINTGQDSQLDQFVIQPEPKHPSIIQPQLSPQLPSTQPPPPIQSIITGILKSQLQLVKLSSQANLKSIRLKIAAMKQLLAEKLQRKHQREIQNAQITLSNNQSVIDDQIVQASEYVVSENVGLRKSVGRVMEGTQA